MVLLVSLVLLVEFVHPPHVPLVPEFVHPPHHLRDVLMFVT